MKTVQELEAYEAREVLINSKLDEFVFHYLKTALWSSTDNSTPSGGEPLDKKYTKDDFSDHALSRAKDICYKFLNKAFEEVSHSIPKAAHNFWLNRNGHGCGFWDDYINFGVSCNKLSDISKSFKEVDVYTGDDGLLHFFGDWDDTTLKEIAIAQEAYRKELNASQNEKDTKDWEDVLEDDNET